MMASMSLSSLSLVLLGCLPLLQGQQLEQHTGYPDWLYSMPWRPLVPPTPQQFQLSQLSPGYTGPQTFPAIRQEQQQNGLFLPQTQLLGRPGPPAQGTFGLPFRPSPFAGYTDDYDEHQAGGGGNSLQEQARGAERAGAYVYLSSGRFYSLFRS
ncbi:uncharacterized protein LOC117894598 [Drosophila subobscura]|uniref:uncharacterized protein LOC117894598 n=1 Tax=Drosophila subobscura TaxID=7241 RepID=UPI00155A9CD7|nr:uncharacterized protein LOC117894598 [Drosophila subobscura]